MSEQESQSLNGYSYHHPISFKYQYNFLPDEENITLSDEDDPENSNKICDTLPKMNFDDSNLTVVDDLFPKISLKKPKVKNHFEISK